MSKEVKKASDAVSESVDNGSSEQTLVKLVNKFDISGMSYAILSRPAAGIVELANPSKKGPEGEVISFFYDTKKEKKVAKTDTGEWVAVRGRLPGTKSPRRTSGPTPSRVQSGIALSANARTVLEEYLKLKGGDALAVVSSLVETHLGAEVQRARDLEERRKKLPEELIDGLAGASDDVRKQVMALLGKS